MANIPVQDTEESAVLTYQAADPAGDSFENDGSVSLSIIGPATGFSVVVANGRDCDFGVHPSYSIDVPVASTNALSPRFMAYRFNNEAGRVSITYTPSAVGIQIAAIKQHVLLTDPV